jgi:hypothetical protein
MAGVTPLAGKKNPLMLADATLPPAAPTKDSMPRQGDALHEGSQSMRLR